MSMATPFLPSQATGTLDTGKDVVLTHLRVESVGDADIGLEHVAPKKVFTAEGHSSHPYRRSGGDKSARCRPAHHTRRLDSRPSAG